MPNVDVAFKPTSLENTFNEHIAKKSLYSLESLKQRSMLTLHSFFNGGGVLPEAPFENEDRALINSAKVMQL